MKTPPILDRRIERTKDALHSALIELIVEKSYESINISEITERANVGRSTFYAHYADKDDLLQGSVQTLQVTIEKSLGKRMQEGYPALGFCLPMLEHVDAARAVFTAMVGKRGGVLFLDFVHDIWVEFVVDHWPQGSTVEVESIVGAFQGVMMWWLSSQSELTTQQVEEQFVSFVTPLLLRKANNSSKNIT